MTPEQIRPVVDIWAAQSRELMTAFSYVQSFENRGEMMGCSNPHPHCQIWASESIPNGIVTESSSQQDYESARGSCMLCDYLALETRLQERIICENASFTVVAPFWAVWPFETMLLPKRHVSLIDGFDDSERNDLARILQQVTACYDNLFATSFPYSMGFHQAHAGARPEAWHFHAHFYPPLLRSATVRKFLVGYEMLATPQRDITIEDAAARLRASLAL
jgi:UDPglucose--hexose-1-phosphate uridylyltransferase